MSSDAHLLPEEKHFGSWWLAEVPEAKVPGWLVIDQQGGQRLRLSEPLSANGHSYTRIAGHLENSMRISLDGCFLLSSQMNFGSGLDRQEWLVHESVFGEEFDAHEPWSFFGADFHFPGLTTWARRAVSGPLSERNQSQRTLPLWRTNEVEVYLDTFTRSSSQSETLSLKERRLDLCVRSSRALGRTELRDLSIRPLQVLLSLAFGHYTGPIQGSGHVTADCTDPPSRRRWEPIEVAFDSARSVPAFDLKHFLMLESNSFLSWVKISECMPEVGDLYVATLREGGLAEARFLLIAQALECFHRRNHEERSILPLAAWRGLRSMLKVVIKRVAPDKAAADALTGKLSSLNGESFHSRLVTLLDASGNRSLAVCGGDPHVFVRSVVATRNYLTHWDQAGESKALNGTDLVYLNNRLLALLEILLLKIVGFQTDSSATNAILRRRVDWLPRGTF